MKNTPLSRQSNLVVQELESELLVYDLSTNKAYCLNETSALVYQLSDGKRTVSEVADLMSIKLKTLVSDDFVWLALNELKREGLLENVDKMMNYFPGISRREIIKKVGVSSMIALPMIASVTAPTPVSAQSIAPPPCRPVGVCVMGGDLCDTCTMGILSVTQFNSMDGTCSGGVLNTRNIDCGGGGSAGTFFDFTINSIT